MNSIYRVELDGEFVGETHLETVDPPMDVVGGKVLRELISVYHACLSPVFTIQRTSPIEGTLSAAAAIESTFCLEMK